MQEVFTCKIRHFYVVVTIGMFVVSGPVRATQTAENERYTYLLDSFFDPVANGRSEFNIENFNPSRDSLLSEEDVRLTERLNRLKDWLRTAGIKRIESAKKEKERLRKKRAREENEKRLNLLHGMSVRDFRTKDENLIYESNFELPQLSGDIVNQLNEIYKGPISRTGSNKGVRQILSFYTDQSGQSPLFPRDYDEQILSRIPEKELEKLEEDDALSNLLSGKTLHKRLLTDKPWALRLLSEHVRRKPILKKQLLQLVEASKTCRSEFAANAAANAMSILNMVDFSFSGMDLRNINAPGAILEDSVMDGADLRNANLTGALLGRASLNQVRFDGANLSGVRFDERVFSGIGRAYNSFSRDGKLLIGCSPEKIQLWDVKSGILLRSFKGNIGYHYNVVLSPNNRWLANVNDGKVKVWDVKYDKKIREFNGCLGCVKSVVFSPDDKWLASFGYNEVVRLWHVESGKKSHSFQQYAEGANSTVFSPNSKQLASAGKDGTVRLWNVESGEKMRTLKGHTDSITSIVFSPNSKWLASIGDDEKVRLWHVKTGKEIRKFQGHAAFVNNVVFSPDSQWMASTGYDQTVRLWNVKTGEEIRKIHGHAAFVNSVMFSPNSEWLAMHTGTHIKLCSAKNKDRLCFSYGVKSLNLRNSPVTFSPDGDLLMQADVSNFDHRLRIVSVTPGHQKLKTNFTEPVEELFFSKDNRRLIGIGRKSKRGVKVINSWSTINGQQTEKKNFRYNKLSVSHDEKLLAVSKGKDLVLMNRETQEVQMTLGGHRRVINKIGFSPSDQYLASVDPNMAHVWDVKSGKKICTINEDGNWLKKIVFSGDEQHLAIIDADRLWLWSLKSCKKIHEFQVRVWLNSVAFSPDSKLLAGAGDYARVWLWDVESGKKIETFRLYGKLNRVVFSPNNRWLACTGGSGTMWLWDVKIREEIQKFYRHTGNFNSIVFSSDSKWLASAGGKECSYLSSSVGDKMVYMFKFNPKSGKFDVQWIQGQQLVLSANGADFRHAKGLTEPQRHLIKQYGGLVDEKVKDIDDWIETEKDDDDEKEAEMEDVG